MTRTGISWVVVIILLLPNTGSDAKAFYQNLNKQLLYVIIALLYNCVSPAHLLHVIIQSYNDQRCWEADIGWYGGPHWRCLIDVTMVTRLQEVGCLVVFIQNFDLEVSESWQGVTIVLLCLEGRGERSIILTASALVLRPAAGAKFFFFSADNTLITQCCCILVWMILSF